MTKTGGEGHVREERSPGLHRCLKLSGMEGTTLTVGHRPHLREAGQGQGRDMNQNHQKQKGGGQGQRTEEVAPDHPGRCQEEVGRFPMDMDILAHPSDRKDPDSLPNPQKFVDPDPGHQ